MIVAGIDVGSKSVKAAILEDNRFKALYMLDTGTNMRNTIRKALTAALEKARLSREDLHRIVATGIGRDAVPEAHDAVTVITADARGARRCVPEARTLIDVGAEEARAIRIDQAGKVLEFATNEKCAAGAGTFTEAMARALETPLEEFGPLSLKSTEKVPVNATCVVFAESEVVSLIHEGVRREDIANAIHEAMVTRIFAMLQRVGIEKEVAFFGGVARNVGVVKHIEAALGFNVIIPEEPEFVSAIGAALLALE